MASFEENLVVKLLAESTLTSLINYRLFPDIIPLKTVYPSICYTIISDVESQSIVAGNFGVIEKYIEFSIYSVNKSESSLIYDVLKTLLKNYNDSTFNGYHLQLTTIENSRSGYDDFKYYRHVEFKFIYT